MGGECCGRLCLCQAVKVQFGTVRLGESRFGVVRQLRHGAARCGSVGRVRSGWAV